MRYTELIGPVPRGFIVALAPVGFWAVLWFSLGAGSFRALLNPSSVGGFIQGIRAVLPFAVAFLAVGLILSRILFRVPDKRILLNPLLLTGLYGLVGLIAVLKSPDGSLAFRWALMYLTVPVVLWAIAYGPDPLGHLQRLMNFNSLVIILAATGLFAAALLKLQLPELIFNPPQFLECKYSGWYDLTSGRLRETGVGRYAAIAVIIALSGLWRPRWRPVWIFVLVTSMALLLFSGARGAFGGIVPGMGLVVLANGGKKVVVAGVAVIILLIPLALSTGAHRTFVDNCIFPGLITPANASVLPGVAGTIPETSPNPLAPTTAPVTEQPQGLPHDGPEEPSTIQKPLFQTGLYPPEYLFRVVPKSFFRFTGRAAVWVDGLRLLKESPVIGYGFHADRLLLNTHMHNSVMQALIQTGLLGTLLFISAMLMGWVLLLKSLRNLGRFPSEQKHLVIQAGGILAFLTVRSFPESTGAFFGVDWLILAPILLYLYTVNFPRREPKT